MCSIQQFLYTHLRNGTYYLIVPASSSLSIVNVLLQDGSYSLHQIELILGIVTMRWASPYCFEVTHSFYMLIEEGSYYVIASIRSSVCP